MITDTFQFWFLVNELKEGPLGKFLLSFPPANDN